MSKASIGRISTPCFRSPSGARVSAETQILDAYQSRLANASTHCAPLRGLEHRQDQRKDHTLELQSPSHPNYPLFFQLRQVGPKYDAALSNLIFKHVNLHEI